MCIIGVFFKHETAYEVRISDWSSDVCSSDLIPERVYKNAPPHLRTIFELGKAWGKRDFLVYDGERLNFDDHYRASVAFGRVLADRFGVRKGDRVAIAMRNFPDWSIAFWGAAAIGAVVVPIKPGGPGPEPEHLLSERGSTVYTVYGERL